MHQQQTRKGIGIVLILALLLCEWCLTDQTIKAYSCAEKKSEITSGVRISVHNVKQMIRQERINGTRSDALLRSTGRRASSLYIRRELTGFSFVEFLPQIFHSTIFLQTYQVPHNTSGHIERIRCVYLKDGKKKIFA